MTNNKDEIIASLLKENESLIAELDQLKSAAREKSKKISKSLRKPVTIRGVTYEGNQAAADALGVSLNTVRSAKQNGRLDTVGTGKQPLTQEARRKAWENKKKKIKFQGCIFNGWDEAKHITGMSRNTLLRRGAKIL